MTDTNHTDRSNLGQIEKKFDPLSTETQHTDSVEALAKELRMVANMINMGEKIQWGHETTLMDKAADMLTTLQAHTSQQVEEAVLQADATGAYHSGYLAGKAEVEEAVRKRNGVIKEYKDEGVMFVLKVEDGKTYEASMPIPKWAEVGKITMRTPNHQD